MSDIIEETTAQSSEPVSAIAENDAQEPVNSAAAENVDNTADEPDAPSFDETAAQTDAENDDSYYDDMFPEEIPSNRPNYLEMTLESRILPLEVRYSQINNPYRKTPVAYRSFTYLNSVIEGVIPPEKYSYASDQSEQGIRMTRWNITSAFEAWKKFDEAGRHVDFVTARVSPQIVRELDVYKYLIEIFDTCGVTRPEKLCLEFPKTVLFEDPEKVRMALLNMKLLKVASMIGSFADYDCPMTPIFDLPFDYVALSPWAVSFAGDRNKKEGFDSMISMIHSLGCKIIADGVTRDEQITILSRADAYGYIPSSEYSGDVEHGRLRMPFDEAVMQQEEEETY
ncbi:MAG: EAL domain-containing protein [Clostridia bacterium]|nr:EAL domain-containing protein [Clostridia bacterium]